jgi:hypothetical protein
VVVEDGAGAPVSGDGAAAGGGGGAAFGAGAFEGASSHQASYRAVMASRSCGLRVVASPRTSVPMVTSRMPRVRAIPAPGAVPIGRRLSRLARRRSGLTPCRVGQHVALAMPRHWNARSCPPEFRLMKRDAHAATRLCWARKLAARLALLPEACVACELSWCALLLVARLAPGGPPKGRARPPP